MHIEQDDVGCGRGDARHRAGNVFGLTHDFDAVAELGSHTGTEQPVVVDDHDANLHETHHARAIADDISSRTSVPTPGAVRTVACPPCRSMRPTIDSFTPSRSEGTASGSKPRPRSRTKTVTFAGSISA